MPFARAFLAIAPSLPCDDRLRYQIHIPSPASGLLALGASPVVWETAPPLSGPAARLTAVAAAAMASRVLRRRKRMVRGYEPQKHAPAGKAALG